MPLVREIALDILGLPSFATVDDIINRYKHLALEWFPERHKRSDYSIVVFHNITKATLSLIGSGKKPSKLDLPQMYHFFQYVFFRGKQDVNEDSCDCESDDCGACSAFVDDYDQELEVKKIKAAKKATELILEEEKEKNKAERKKAKKKRRKERKKLQKVDNETNTEKVLQKENPPSDSNTKESKKREVLKSSDSEEGLDPSSAFVSVVAKKHRKHIPQLPTKETVVVNPPNHYQPDIMEENEEDPEIIILKSRQIALDGNKMANEGKYAEAIELFTESIKLDPSDHRFYGNRSYCYDRLCSFDKALKDADKSIKLCPVWPKGYFRKGRALLGLKKYALAEKFFVEVLKLDNDCEDAISELRKAKLLQIMEEGFTKEVAEAALSRHGTVSEALSSLLSSGISRVTIQDDLDIFISDDEIESTWKAPAKPKPITQSPFYDIKKDPNNPEGHNSLWIGSVQPDVTEKKLTSMFGKYGELLSVKVMPEKKCAFVNYKSKSSPGKAMQACQGLELNGAFLKIRFPNLPGETIPSIPVKKPGVIGQELKKLGPVNGNECYFWRNKGCFHGETCRYKHIKENKGIDLKNG